MSDDVKIPSISDLLWPVLQATHALGGSAARAELMEHVRGVAGLTDEQIAVVYSGPTGKSKALHRIEWAIYWLKAMGVLEEQQGRRLHDDIGRDRIPPDERRCGCPVAWQEV